MSSGGATRESYSRVAELTRRLGSTYDARALWAGPEVRGHYKGMYMRSMMLLATAAAAVALFGCNSGQPRIYHVAVDPTPLLSLPASCFANNSTEMNTSRTTISNWRSEYEWVIWDGADGKQYLDLGGSTHFDLGDAQPVDVIGLIEGQDGTFVGSETRVHLDTNNSGYTNTRTKSLTVTFEDQGAAPKGTLDLVSNYTCTNCADGETEMPGNKNCSTRLTFSGRRVDTQRISVNE